MKIIFNLKCKKAEPFTFSFSGFLYFWLFDKWGGNMGTVSGYEGEGVGEEVSNQ